MYEYVYFTHTFFYPFSNDFKFLKYELTLNKMISVTGHPVLQDICIACQKKTYRPIIHHARGCELNWAGPRQTFVVYNCIACQKKTYRPIIHHARGCELNWAGPRQTFVVYNFFFLKMTNCFTRKEPYLLPVVVWITLKLPKYRFWTMVSFVYFV